MSHQHNNLVRSFVMAAGLVTAAPAVVTAAEPVSASGNIGVYSKYVLRGIQAGGGESAGPVLQGGFDLSHSSGAYAGYWASNLGYADQAGESGFENDFYAGYSGEVAGLSYGVGAIYYKYIEISDADAPEIVANIGYGRVTFGAQYLAQDVVWGNVGDIYWTASAGTDLPKDFSVSATLGYYTYADSGEYIASTPITSGFRHLNVSISHPLGDTGAEMSVSGILGGVDRNDVSQGSTAVLGLSYGFDI